MWASLRTVRIADGPDEVHLQQLGKSENKRGVEVQKKLARQKHAGELLMKQYGVKDTKITSRL